MLFKLIKSFIITDKGRFFVEFSSYYFYVIIYLVGITSKGLFIFRNGNVMCEYYEVFEVLGLVEEGINVVVFLVFWNDLV